MTFWPALKATYSGSTAFIIACPLLASMPVAIELIQHWAEVQIGMYDSVEAALAVEKHPVRMALALLKVVALTLAGYWITRFLAYRDPALAREFNARAVSLFAPFAIVQIGLAAFQLFGVSQHPRAQMASFVGGTVAGILLAAWGIAAPLGNADIGPRASVIVMWRQLPWTFVFMLVALLPLMIPHYAFGALAIVGPKFLLWPLLVVDSLLVGVLSATIIAINYQAAIRAADKAGLSLEPKESRLAGKA